MLETFVLRLALGFALGLWALPAGVVASRFYRIHLLIVLGFIVGAGFAARADASEVFWIALGLAGVLCLVGAWNWGTEGRAAGYGALLLCTLALAVAVLALPEGASPSAPLVFAARALSSAALLGVVTTAMLMGHWYLIAPTMSLTPLVRLLQALFAALALRALVAGVEFGLWLAFDQPLDRLAWIWLAVRWGVGFIGLAVLAWMAWQTTKIRSTQSATGILYVAVIFCFLGELTDQLLQEHVGRSG
jgi:hypothetical protein